MLFRLGVWHWYAVVFVTWWVSVNYNLVFSKFSIYIQSHQVTFMKAFCLYANGLPRQNGREENLCAPAHVVLIWGRICTPVLNPFFGTFHLRPLINPRNLLCSKIPYILWSGVNLYSSIQPFPKTMDHGPVAKINEIFHCHLWKILEQSSFQILIYPP